MNSFQGSLYVCLSSGCVSESVNEPLVAEVEAPPPPLQDNFTAPVNLQESHQCVSECAQRHMCPPPAGVCLHNLYACASVCM